jgi:hypothetical protein
MFDLLEYLFMFSLHCLWFYFSVLIMFNLSYFICLWFKLILYVLIHGCVRLLKRWFFNWLIETHDCPSFNFGFDESASIFFSTRLDLFHCLRIWLSINQLYLVLIYWYIRGLKITVYMKGFILILTGLTWNKIFGNHVGLLFYKRIFSFDDSVNFRYSNQFFVWLIHKDLD